MNRPQVATHLQKSDINDTVAVGLVDPCLVFLEAKDQDRHVLITCWANSSQEVKKTGEPARLELRNLLVFGWYPDQGKTPPNLQGPSNEVILWLFRTGGLESLQIEGDEPEVRLRAPEKVAPLDSLGLATQLANRIHVKYLTQEEMAVIRTSLGEKKFNRVSVANLVLKLGGLDWPSLSEARRSLNSQPDTKPLSDDEKKVLRALDLKRPVGKLANLLTVADQIQAFGFARKTGEIHFTNVPTPARINLVEGEILDAQFGLLTGLEAAIALINLKDPQTEFIVGERAHRKTIDMPFLQVLREAARVTDEFPVSTQLGAPEGGMPVAPYLQVNWEAKSRLMPFAPA